MDKTFNNAAAETLHYLKGINQSDLNKIPKRFIEFLNENSSKNYECKFDYNKPLKELKLMDETRGLISFICLNYWCENEEQKNLLKKHLNENELLYQKKLEKKYNINNIFDKNKKIEEDIKNNKDNFLCTEKKESILERFKKFKNDKKI